MRTTKPISTISYNTSSYLRLKLDELKKAKIISVWHYIEHLPEDDEGGKKEHIHLYIEPSKLIQTDDLVEHFKEFDAEKPDKPRKCLSFRTSKFGDWYMYAVHDKAYLASKGQSRRYFYCFDDFVTSDADELYRAFKEIDLSYLTPLKDIVAAVEGGITFTQFFALGRVPLEKVNYYEKAFQLVEYERTYRNGRKTHSPAGVDIDTGEIVKEIEKNLKDTERPSFKSVSAEEIRKINEIFK